MILKTVIYKIRNNQSSIQIGITSNQKYFLLDKCRFRYFRNNVSMKNEKI